MSETNAMKFKLEVGLHVYLPRNHGSCTVICRHKHRERREMRFLANLPPIYKHFQFEPKKRAGLAIRFEIQIYRQF